MTNQGSLLIIRIVSAKGGKCKEALVVYQIIRITDKEGVAKAEPMDLANQGCIGDAKMEDGCMLIHCRYDKRGDPCDRYIRTSIVQDWKRDRSTGRVVIMTMNSVYYLDPVRMNG